MVRTEELSMEVIASISENEVGYIGFKEGLLSRVFSRKTPQIFEHRCWYAPGLVFEGSAEAVLKTALNDIIDPSLGLILFIPQLRVEGTSIYGVPYGYWESPPNIWEILREHFEV